jgi:hypothetical protein
MTEPGVGNDATSQRYLCIFGVDATAASPETAGGIIAGPDRRDFEDSLGEEESPGEQQENEPHRFLDALLLLEHFFHKSSTLNGVEATWLV